VGSLIRSAAEAFLADFERGLRGDIAHLLDHHALLVGIFDQELDPQGVAFLVVGRPVRFAKGCNAVRLRAASDGGEAGKFEDHGRPLIHFAQGEGERLPGRFDPDLGAAADRGFTGIFEALAIALEDDRIGDRAGLEPAEIAGNAETPMFPVQMAAFQLALISQVSSSEAMPLSMTM
jgi:hypothetical protein